MGRVLLFCLKAAVLIGLAFWLAMRPGEVSIEWLGYRLDTSVGILILAVAVLAATAALMYRFWRFLLRAPHDLTQRARAGKRQRGYQALTQGMVAVAAGEREEAARWARKADTLLDEPPLTMLLSAQAAQLTGDEAAARRYFTSMLDNEETKFLGLRGLLTQALREGDETRALDLARRAHALRPRTPWVLHSLFDLSQRCGDLETAERALKESVRAKALPRPEAERKHAVLLLERALSARREGAARREGEASAAGDGAAGDGAALDLAREARKLAPELIAASALFAELLIEADDKRKAARAIEEAWAVAPHPELARLYLLARPNQDSIERLKTLGRLAERNRSHPETHLARARAALEARLWGEARRHLEAAAGPGGLEGDPRESVCRLMAELEEEERADAEAARAWLSRAAGAARDPGWVCAACGALAEAWSARCGKCRAFDALAWTAPPHVALSATPTALEAPAESAGALALAAPEEDTKANLPAVTGTAAP
jgi:HemY protein